MNFHRIGVLTVVAIYLLIFVGGVVRSTGSGMGCPDWPKCFGMWVPPTSVDQLPLNYQEIYGAKLKGEVIFNPTKTWIEYLNRLLGALIGVFVFISFLYSLKFRKADIQVTIWAAIALFLTGFQGWIGSKVVSTELKTYMVSIHMVIAILIVFVLLFALFRAKLVHKRTFDFISPKTSLIVWITFIITFVQLFFGIQVREQIDTIAKAFGESVRNNWIDQIGIKFLVHRSFSILVLGFNIFLVLSVRKTNLEKYGFYLIIFVLSAVVSGMGLNYLGFPAFVQPIHLTIAIIILGIQMQLIFNTNRMFSKKLD